MSFEIIIAAEAVVELGVSVDIRLTRLVAEVVADFCAGTGRTFEKKERTIYVFGFGSKVDYVFFTEVSVVSIIEVRIDPTGVLGVDIAIDDVAISFWYEPSDFGFALHYLNGYFPEGPRVAMVKFIVGYNMYEVSGGTVPEPP